MCPIERSASFKASGFAVGGKLSLADTALFDIFDLHIRPAAFPEIATRFPNLAAVHAKVGAVPSIAAYLSSAQRPAKVNGNEHG